MKSARADGGPGVQVQAQVVEAEQLGVVEGRAPPEERAQAGEELGEVERLDQVVVRAGVEGLRHGRPPRCGR